MIWTDFGIRYLGLATDTQTLAYVLKPGERGAPEGLKAGLGEANRMADLLLAELQSGRSGNDVLLSARAAAQAKGIDATLYSHPIGTHGHGAGPAIGFWDDQAPGPRGAGPIRPMTALDRWPPAGLLSHPLALIFSGHFLRPPPPGCRGSAPGLSAGCR